MSTLHTSNILDKYISYFWMDYTQTSLAKNFTHNVILKIVCQEKET